MPSDPNDNMLSTRLVSWDSTNLSNGSESIWMSLYFPAIDNNTCN